MTHRNRERRRGLIAVAVLLGLMALALLLALLFRSVALQRLATARLERRIQAEALAESGLERAIARLRRTPEYHGENWEIAASTLRRRDDALVAIQVEAVANQPNQRRIVVRADYPRPAERRIRITRETIVETRLEPRSDQGAPK